MYSNPNLDAPPPRSQFRRPWSPEPYEPYTHDAESSNRWQNTQYNVQSEQGHSHSHVASPLRQQQQRREGSDVSVEALDLADYAKTLRIRQAEDPYPPFPSQAHHPPSSFPPLPPLASSRDSLAIHPPSLVSRGTTLSSNVTHLTASSSVPSRARHAARRPFSMPPTPHNSTQVGSSRDRLGQPSPYRGPHIFDPGVQNPSSEEIDVTNFPKWSRGWYDSNNSNNNGNTDGDIYTPLPTSHLNSATKKSPFDPGYVHDPRNSYNSDPFGTYSYDHPPLSSVDSRDVLPWSNDPPEYGPPLDPMLREERMRMLEREFGNKAKSKGRGLGKSLVDEDGKLLVGTVDEKGNLVTTGPKRRIVFRVLQIMLAIGACIPAIYAAVAIKPTDTRYPPPPANKPPVFVLYVLSSVTLLLLLYMFAIRPCCCGRKKPSSKHPFGAAANMGMMVLPVGGAGKKNKKPKRGKKGKGKYGAPGGQGDVQVNLIVDPTAFQPPGGDDSDSEDEEYDSQDENSMPGGFDDRHNHAKRKKRNKKRRRRGVVEGLKMEEEWRVARAWAKKVTVVDVAGLVFWGAAFVFIMTGKRCPSGAFDGWCNAYNASTASACLLAVAFGVTTFFDVQDLHASKQSPRTRG